VGAKSSLPMSCAPIRLQCASQKCVTYMTKRGKVRLGEPLCTLAERVGVKPTAQPGSSTGNPARSRPALGTSPLSAFTSMAATLTTSLFREKLSQVRRPYRLLGLWHRIQGRCCSSPQSISHPSAKTGRLHIGWANSPTQRQKEECVSPSTLLR
jgi:hypothetical protein